MRSTKIIFFLSLLLALPLVFINCNSPSDTKVENPPTTGGTTNITLTGYIANASGTALDSVVVRAITNAGEYYTSTDSYGKYILKFTLDSSRTVRLISYKSGYLNDTTKVFAIINTTNNISTIYMKTITVSTSTTGPAASIFLRSQSTAAIGVRTSGSPETVSLTFQAVDSLGNPIDLAHKSIMHFKFGGKPGGGEFIYPDYAYTDTSGSATVYLTSGTKAGTVQIIAEITNSTRVITSIPIAVAIHGGSPDLPHFSIAPAKLNFPGYNISGLMDGITAYVGDKYANPVRPNTAVYFTSTGGIIEGSALTSIQGIGTVNLISADPRPVHPTLGKGFATVTGSTIDENLTIISYSIPVLFSGIPWINITPMTFDIPNGGSQTFNYEVKDQNDNPLSSGTSISVNVEGENVKTGGEMSINVPDTQSKGWTKFSFFIYDSVDTLVVAKKITVRITTTGPNGDAQLTISGISR